MIRHSYEEIREAVLHLLRKSLSMGSQYRNLEGDLARFFEQKGEPGGRSDLLGGQALSPSDAETFLEVFWDLFRQGIITLGSDASNPEFPFFRVSAFGRRILEGGDSHFFHDVSSYEAVLRRELPGLDLITLLYLKEAMQAFLAGCVLSSSVMLGVATEHAFMQLLEAIESGSPHAATFKGLMAEHTLLRRFNKFRRILEQNLPLLQTSTREDLDTNFGGILSLIRTFRNESGHPSGKIISRDQAYVLLHLFVPCCKKIYEVRHDLCRAGAPAP